MLFISFTGFLLIIWVIAAVFIVAFCAKGSKPDSMVIKYSGTAPKPKLRIMRTVLPDKRLKKNEWYAHINQLRNGKI